ncbi:integrase [Noviherbaspirillum cavernae]|uniref:Integrase n=1 Tax=Noviherbaspirillum cavernae TaxID=2320862 RepID=A0A418WYV7_9BURK|nr:Mu transposase C-terminal domain-containing protein [Noviherbaspirillum cavernae]RJG05362.1 integrase [Noviherbaspirillum cavernae]
MLETSQRERLLDRLGLPTAGCRLVLNAAKYAPVRQVRSKGGGNVITPYQSRKMQCTVETESRHLEFPVAVSHEHNPEVLEYFPQPCQLKFEVTDADGEIHTIDHTPDFLVVTERGVCFEECKSWSKLESLARRLPWRYQLSPDNLWEAPLIAQWLAERGIGYRIRTDREIPQRRIENILFLEDYLDPAAPACPVEVALRVRDALAQEAVLYLVELYAKAECRSDDVFKLIADGELVADLDCTSLSEPTRCRIFRDTSVREFEFARKQSASFTLPGTLDITEGARLTYDQTPYSVVMVGGSKVILQSDTDKRQVEVSLKALEELAAQRNIVMADGFALARTPTRLSDFTEAELKVALRRKVDLEQVSAPNRSQRRHLQVLSAARLAGSDELAALVPRLRDRGNRKPRLTSAQEAAMEYVIRETYLSSKAPNAKHCYRSLRVYCAQQDIKAPSYPTLIARIKSLPQQQADRARHGNRIAYQNSEFVNVLYADTPIHGLRAFQYVHMDHTQLDIELVSLRTGKRLGRPWLSLAIDAFTRRILGVYLSFDAPSYRSNMMLLRDIVYRHRRLPQFIVVDNGADFRSENFALAAEMMCIHLRYRPVGQPRHGAVMERIFGHMHSTYIYNLAGNTKAMKEVRSTTGKFLPSRLAEWTLEALYYGIEHWAFTYYDTEVHSALGMSPRDASTQSVEASGLRAHRIVTLTEDFLILTSPAVKHMGGQRIVDRQRGIKLHNTFYYWCPEFRDPKLHGKKVQVRCDPWDASTVYVQVDKRWMPARCKTLASLGQLTDKERELVSGELRMRYRMADNDEPSLQRLAEFMRTFTPEGAMALDMDRQQENRELYEHIGRGAITRPTPITPMLQRAEPTVGVSKADKVPRLVPVALPMDFTDIDPLDFDTF